MAGDTVTLGDWLLKGLLCQERESHQGELRGVKICLVCTFLAGVKKPALEEKKASARHISHISLEANHPLALQE